MGIKIKQYIVLRHEISPALACIACSHGVLAAYLKWQNEDIVKDWISGKYGPFYKCVCQAQTLQEWDAIQKWENGITITESSIGCIPVCVVFKPFIWSKSSIFNSLKLYGNGL